MSLRNRLFLSHAAVAVLGLLVLSATVLVLLGDVQRNLRLQALGSVALNLARNARAITPTPDSLEALTDRLQRANRDRANTRALLINADGIVTWDSARANDASMLGQRISLTERPSGISLPTEIEAAHEYRDPQRRRWVYAAMPVENLLPTLASTRAWIAVGQPLRNGFIWNLLDDDMATPVLQALGLTMLLAAAVAAFASRGLARPIQQLAGGANAIAAGHYEQRVSPNGPAEMQMLARDFNRMAERVEAAQRSERDFLANISHELKTPLTSIAGFAQAIADGTATNAADTRQAATVIHDEAARLGRLVNELLDSARLESGAVTLRREQLDVNALARAVHERMRERAAKQGVNWLLTPAALPFVSADADRIIQVITNLADNALKHTPSGTINIETMVTANRVRVSVTDTGQGIPEGELPRIFERFFMVEKSRTRAAGGSGLGLAICRQIIEAHGGGIDARSKPGNGTTISFWLPTSTSDTAPSPHTGR